MNLPAATTFTPLPQPAGHDLLVFLLQIGLLLGLALLLGRLAARAGLPSVVGELLTGVLLGPSLLGHLAPQLWQWLFPDRAAQANMTNALAQVGMLLLVGLSGLHVDLALIRRRGVTAVRISLGGLAIPLGFGVALGWLLPAVLRSPTAGRGTFAFFLGVAMCVSAIPVIAKTLLDMGLLHRDIGQLTLAAGAVDDAVGWCLLSVVSALALGGVHGWQIALTVAEILGFLVVVAVLGRPLARALFGLAGRSPDNGPAVGTAVVLVLGSAAATQALGLEPAFGAFVAGALLGAGPVRQVLDPARLAPLRTFVLWVAAPVFLATAGLRMDLTALARPSVALAALAVLGVAVLGKFAGAFLGARLSGLPAREGFALGAGMNARGVVEVVVAMAGLRLGVITTATYTIIVLVAVVTSVMAPPLLRWAMAGVDSTAGERARGLEHARWAGAAPSVAGDGAGVSSRRPASLSWTSNALLYKAESTSWSSPMSDLYPTQIFLTEQEQDTFRLLADELAGIDPVTETEQFVMSAQLLSSRLPERIRRAGLQFRRHGDPSGGLLLRNLPVDPLPPTPEHADYGLGIRLPAARVFSLASALVGEQFGFQPELAGQIIQDILPVAGFEDTQQSISSRALLELHCETVFTDYRADVIGLLCLRPDPERIARTVLAPTAVLLPLLDERTLSILSELRFSTTVDGSFLRGSGLTDPILIGPVRVLDGDPRRPRIRCDFAETRGLDEEAQAALDTLYAVASEAVIDTRLEAGDLLLIDNHDAFHGRSSFRYHGDGEDRWLLRTFITRDLSRSRVHRPGDGRIVDTDYAAGSNVMVLSR